MQNTLQRILFSLALLITTTVAHAQNDVQLADAYFSDGAYEQAKLYYEKLVKERPTNFNYERLFQCYVSLEDFRSAEKLMKERVRRDRRNYALQVELGAFYTSIQDKKKAVSIFDDLLDQLERDPGQTIAVARAFMKQGENEYALKAFEIGKKKIKGFTAYNYEIAQLYGQLGRYDEMVEAYLQMIDSNPRYLQTVQNTLNRNMEFDADSPQKEALKKGLLKRIQKDPDAIIFNELLIWIYLQEEAYFPAIAQTKALDRRLKEDGRRLMSLARLLARRELPKLAINALEGVIAKGPNNYYYNDAKLQLLDLKAGILAYDPTTKQESWKMLATEYETFRSGVTDYSYKAKADQAIAAIEARHLNRAAQAIDRLLIALNYPQLTDELIAKLKIDIGDYYVMVNNVWDAALYYGQAEKLFKYDYLGEVAKFKYGKIGYFTGDFEWASAQFDVLKGSTSKLIANDAMYLSVLIRDNSTIDTSFVPLQNFARADLYREQRRFLDAISLLDSIATEFPGHSLSDDILYRKYQNYLDLNQLDKASSNLVEIMQQHPNDILMDEAIYYLGKLNEERLNKPDVAMNYYQELLTNHPASLFVTDARKRFRELRGDQQETL